MEARTVVGRGKGGRYVTPDLSYYWEGAREQCEDNKWNEAIEIKIGLLLLLVGGGTV